MSESMNPRDEIEFKNLLSAALDAYERAEDAALERELDRLSAGLQALALEEQDVPDILHAFGEDLRCCKDKWEVTRLLHEYAKPYGFFQVRFHHLDHSSCTLVCSACAGMASTVEEQIRSLRGVAKTYRFLWRSESDSLWSFHYRAPTLFRVDHQAERLRESHSGLCGVPMIVLPKDQCGFLLGFKGEVWVDFPFQVGGLWAGKLSCDIHPSEVDRPGFGRAVQILWKLVQMAGVHLELFAGKTLQASQVEFKDQQSGANYALFERLLSDDFSPVQSVSTREAIREDYEATHGEVEHAAIAAFITAFMQPYAREAIALDGGETTLAIAKAIVQDVHNGKPSVRMIMTNNLGVLSIIPAKGKFPRVEDTGGVVRRRSGKPGAVLPDAALIARLRLWSFAACIIGTTGMAPPYLLTFSGEEHDIKEAFIDTSADVIVPLTSPKWGRFVGRKFLDLRTGNGDTGRLFLVTVFPHEDHRDPVPVRSQGYAIRERFLEGIQSVAKQKNVINIGFAKAEFQASNGLYPEIKRIDDGDGKDICGLEEMYERINPDHRSDVRLIVWLELSRCGQPDHSPGLDLGGGTRILADVASRGSQPATGGHEHPGGA